MSNEQPYGQDPQVPHPGGNERDAQSWGGGGRARRWVVGAIVAAVAATALVWVLLGGSVAGRGQGVPTGLAQATTSSQEAAATLPPPTDAPTTSLEPTTSEDLGGAAGASDTTDTTSDGSGAGSAPAVRWQGKVKVPVSWYVQLDEVPVTVQRGGGDIGYRDDAFGYEAGGMAEWRSATAPAYDECLTRLRTEPLGERATPKVGLKRCVLSGDGRVAFVEILALERNGRMTLAVTVWEGQVNE